VSRSTATGLLYPVPAFAPWIMREASPAPSAPAPPPRPSPGRHPNQALQSSDREGLRPLDPPVHLLPRQAAPCRDGPSRDLGIPVLARRTGQGRRLNPEPGTQRVALPVARGARGGPAVARRCRAGQAPPVPARGPHPRGDPGGPAATDRRAADHGASSLRRRPPPAGVLPAA
jgi:hypothetical protein